MSRRTLFYNILYKVKLQYLLNCIRKKDSNFLKLFSVLDSRMCVGSAFHSMAVEHGIVLSPKVDVLPRETTNVTESIDTIRCRYLFQQLIKECYFCTIRCSDLRQERGYCPERKAQLFRKVRYLHLWQGQWWDPWHFMDAGGISSRSLGPVWLHQSSWSGHHTRVVFSKYKTTV
jgi:hypothetical protein